MSIPYTIVEAYRILQQQPLKYSDGNSDISPTPIIVDIMAIVQNLSISQPSAGLAPTSIQKARSAVVKCQLWLVDDSCLPISSKSCGDIDGDGDDARVVVHKARFCLYGTVDVARVQEERIQPGDLLRFNGVSLSDHPASMISPESSPCFRFSSVTPEPGVRWCRLGNSRPNSQLVSSSPTTVDYSLLLAPAMKTCPQRVQALIDWSRDKQNGITNHRASKLTLQLPCRKRRLEELHTSVGLRSNLQVRVTTVFTQAASMVTSTTFCNRNNTSGITNTNKRPKMQHSVPQFTIATVTDDSGTVMTLVDTLGRFQGILDEATAKRSTHSLVLTHVLTQRMSKLVGSKRACPTDEVTLTVTNESSAFLLASTEMAENEMVAANNESQTQALGRVDMPLGDQYQTTLISEVMDLVTDGLSFCQNAKEVFISPAAFRERILVSNADSRRRWQYQESANVQLCSEKYSSCKYLISPSVLQCLCGGLDAEDMVDDDSLCRHAINFIQALLRDKVQLKWSIDCSPPNQTLIPIVVKVVLHGLQN